MSAAPETEVCARLPCLDIKSREEAMSEAVVLILYVWTEAPPVPTISHWLATSVYTGIVTQANIPARHDRFLPRLLES